MVGTNMPLMAENSAGRPSRQIAPGFAMRLGGGVRDAGSWDEEMNKKHEQPHTDFQRFLLFPREKGSGGRGGGEAGTCRPSN